MLCYKRPCKNRVFRTIHKYTPKQCFFFAKETRNIEGGGEGGGREKKMWINVWQQAEPSSRNTKHQQNFLPRFTRTRLNEIRRTVTVKNTVLLGNTFARRPTRNAERKEDRPINRNINSPDKCNRRRTDK